MPKPELTTEQKIQQANKDVSDCMIKKIQLSGEETKIQLAKKNAHHLLQKAKERLQALESELLSN